MLSMPEFTRPVCPEPVSDSCVIDKWNWCAIHVGVHAVDTGAALRPDDGGERERLLACPDWCARDHSDDLSTPTDNLVLHDAHDLTDGSVRRLLNVHDGSKLDIRVARTDCPEEGRRGAPALVVHADLELTTWEQAAELARAILDGFGYLRGADQEIR